MIGMKKTLSSCTNLNSWI